MQRKKISTLFILCLVLSSVPVFLNVLHTDEDQSSTTESFSITLDYSSLAELYGEVIPVVVEFKQGLTNQIKNIINSLDLEFSLGSAKKSHISSCYLMKGTKDALEALTGMGVVSRIAPQTHAQFLESPRDISIPEINADSVWAMLDDLSRNITGKDILIADLDSGVDWRHPDLWFADGGSYPYVNSTSSGFVNGTDAVDFNRDFALSPNETLYALDMDRNGIFNARTEWLWVDNIAQNAFPDYGELFFVVNDTSGNGLLDGGEDLVLLGTPKTKYIVEKDGNPVPSVQTWERGVNLTASTHYDTSQFGGGHGTAVAGILLGGQVGFRDYVGVAPDAELMMIRVLGDQFTWLSIEEGLAIANSTGADVILTEIGSWTYHYLDGSSLAESFIDDLVAQGIPVISPSGNLGGKDKHAMVATAPGVPHLIDFSVPPVDGIYVQEDITEVYITVLTVDPTDFITSNFSLYINGTTTYLTPGIGEGLWFLQSNILPGVNVQSYTSISTRGTKMLAIWLYGVLPTTPPSPFYQLNITTPDSATIHAYIADDQSSWTGGCVWMIDQVDSYHITWPSTADRAISVASYRTRDLVAPETIGGRASFSSRGPRIDGLIKQNVAAPGGYDIISDYSNGTTYSTWYNGYGILPFTKQFGSYRLFSGTSASGPHVAGAAALLLQANSSIGDQIQPIIESTARSDGFTGAVPNADWGGGKLDIEAALNSIRPPPDVDGPVIGSHTRTPWIPTSVQSPILNLTVTDISGVSTVILSFWNGTGWYNSTMTLVGSFYIGSIPAHPNGTAINYRFYANDTLDNWSVSTIFGYTVNDNPPITTTTATTTTTITTTSPTTTPTGPTTTPPPNEPDYLRLAIFLSAVLALIILSVVCSRRRKR
ncbi:MAG: S8 family serine peptidase [Candidatus Thorarchaeota archaeon]